MAQPQVLLQDDNGNAIPVFNLGGAAAVLTTTTSASVATAAVLSGTAWVTIYCVASEDCHITSDASPTATTSMLLLKAGTYHTFNVPPGHKLAIIRSGASNSTLYYQLHASG